MTIKCKQAKTISEIIEAIRLRLKVFYYEQSVKPLEDVDEHDGSANHFIAVDGKKIVGAARARISDNRAKIERMAIDKKYRSKGVGRLLAENIIRSLKRKKVKKIYLNAQYYVKGFYEKIGFEATGKPFYDARIKHIMMVYKK